RTASASRWAKSASNANPISEKTKAPVTIRMSSTNIRFIVMTGSAALRGNFGAGFSADFFGSSGVGSATGDGSDRSGAVQHAAGAQVDGRLGERVQDRRPEQAPHRPQVSPPGNAEG